jgi:uncharacterized protein DUF4260
MHATTIRRTIPAARVAYAIATTLLLAAVIFEAAKHGLWGAAAIGLLAPDLPLLAGGGSGLAKGQLHKRAVPAYNLAHRLIGPLALLVAASIGLFGLGFFVAGLAWSTHIALDRAVGYRLRTPEGFQRD